MKKKTLNLIKTIFRYGIPAIVGWLEGDMHAVSDSISALLSILF